MFALHFMWLRLRLQLRHVDDTTDTFSGLRNEEVKWSVIIVLFKGVGGRRRTYMHVVETIIDFLKGASMGNVFVNLDFSGKIVYTYHKPVINFLGLLINRCLITFY